MLFLKHNCLAHHNVWHYGAITPICFEPRVPLAQIRNIGFILLFMFCIIFFKKSLSTQAFVPVSSPLMSWVAPFIVLALTCGHRWTGPISPSLNLFEPLPGSPTISVQMGGLSKCGHSESTKLEPWNSFQCTFPIFGSDLETPAGYQKLNTFPNHLWTV